MRSNSAPSATTSTATLGLREAAERAGVHYMTAYRWIRTGRLDAIKSGGEWQVRQVDLDALVHGRRDAELPPARRRRVDYVARLATRLREGDEAGAVQIANDALTAGQSAEELYLDTFVPAMTAVGDAWARQQATIAEEHRATAIMLRLLGQFGTHFRRRGRRLGTIVVGVAGGDHHGLGAAFLVDPLRGRGYDVIDLGADVPSSAFVDACSGVDQLNAVAIHASVAEAVVVSTTIQALRDAGITCPIVLGGAAIPSQEVALSLGADEWHPTLRGALDALTASG